MKKSPVLINLVGPTASGKTAVAIRLAKDLNTEIISADSRQIYREMKIGTAVPTKEELESVKHHLIQHKSIHDKFTVSDFEKETIQKIKELTTQYPVVIMTGGTGLYFNAVNYGLDEIPEIPQQIRKKLTILYEKQGIRFLQEELKRKDLLYYQQVDLNNPRRLIRALEVIDFTGKPFSSFRKDKHKKRPFDSLWFGLNWPREILYKRINQRVDKMIEQGLIEEAKQLYPIRHLNALQTVGYKELFDYFEGKISLDKAIDEIKKNTRRYAKRQLTWFKKNHDIIWLDMEKSGNAYEEMLNAIKKRLASKA